MISRADFNFSAFNGKELSYVRDSVYEVPDSITGWRIDWYYKPVFGKSITIKINIDLTLNHFIFSLIK